MRVFDVRVFDVNVAISGDDLAALQRLARLYGTPPGTSARDVRAMSSDAPEVHVRLDRAGDGAVLELATPCGRREVALSGDVGHRVHASHLALVQAAATQATGHVLHGGLLRRGEQAVWITGAPGTGKTTLTLAMADMGWDVLADDFAWLDDIGTPKRTQLPLLATPETLHRLRREQPDDHEPLRAHDGRTLIAMPLSPRCAANSPERSAAVQRLHVVVLRPDGPHRRIPLSEALLTLAPFHISLAGHRYLHGADGTDAVRSMALLHQTLAGLNGAVDIVSLGDPLQTAQLLSRRFFGSDPPISVHIALEMLNRGEGVTRVAVQGGSMRPLLRGGEHVRLRAGRARFGDIVVARNRHGSTVVHRVVGVRNGQPILRGDDTASADPPRQPDTIIGRVVAREPGVSADPSAAPVRLDGPIPRVIGWAIAGWARIEAWLAPYVPDPLRLPRPRAIMTLWLLLQQLTARPIGSEERLVLLAARAGIRAEGDDEGLSADRSATRDLLDGDLDEDRVLRLARLGQIGPLVYRGVRRIEAGQAPALNGETRDELRALYAVGWARARRVAEVRGEILAALAEQEIPVLGHKAIALKACVYDDPVLRLAGDIDLSVPDHLRRRAERAAAGTRDHLARVHPDRRDPDALHVELDGSEHHDLDPRRHGHGRWAGESLDWPGIWARAVQMRDAAGHPFLVPDPTDLLLTLIANAVRRGGYPPRLIVDIAATIEKLGDRIDWQRLTDDLAATRLDRRSWWVLDLAVQWLGASVPAPLCEPPTDLHPAWWERLSMARRFRRPFERTPTRLLWAGSAGRAIAVAWHLAVGTLRGRVRRILPAG